MTPPRFNQHALVAVRFIHLEVARSLCLSEVSLGMMRMGSMAQPYVYAQFMMLEDKKTMPLFLSTAVVLRRSLFFSLCIDHEMGAKLLRSLGWRL